FSSGSANSDQVRFDIGVDRVLIGFKRRGHAFHSQRGGRRREIRPQALTAPSESRYVPDDGASGIYRTLTLCLKRKATQILPRLCLAGDRGNRRGASLFIAATKRGEGRLRPRGGLARTGPKALS